MFIDGRHPPATKAPAGRHVCPIGSGQFVNYLQQLIKSNTFSASGINFG